MHSLLGIGFTITSATSVAMLIVYFIERQFWRDEAAQGRKWARAELLEDLYEIDNLYRELDECL